MIQSDRAGVPYFLCNSDCLQEINGGSPQSDENVVVCGNEYDNLDGKKKKNKI